jgi:chaperonin GroES
MKKTKSKLKQKVTKKPAAKAISQFGVTPLGSRVLIRPFTKEELQTKNSFGIILPDSGSKEKSEQGTVLALGPGEYHDGKLVLPTVKVGDKVAFSKYGYEDISINGEELYLIKEENVLAILK